LHPCCRLKRLATLSHKAATASSRRYRYTKVLDHRKHAIRGLWRRNGSFVARITVEDDSGRKAVKWVPLQAQTVAEAQDEFRKLLVERSENRLRHIGQCPRFAEYLEQTCLPRLAAFGKKPDTLVTETGHLGGWCERIGHLHLDKVRPHHIAAHLQKLKESGKANRTCNLALAMIRNVLKSARVDGFIKTLPVEGIQWQRTERKATAPPQSSWNGVRSIGGEANPFFKLATDWSSILSVRAGTACGSTSTRGSSR